MTSATRRLAVRFDDAPVASPAMRARAWWIALSVAMTTAWGGLAAAPGKASAAARTYVANCGTASYLDYRPAYWSAGCTAGSGSIKPIRWRSWGARIAI